MTYYREAKFLEHSPIIWYYLLKKRLNKNALTATLLYYVKQGYISMEVISNNGEKDYEFKIVKDLDAIPQVDIICLKSFFNKTLNINITQKLSVFEKIILCEETFGSVSDIYKALIVAVKKQLVSDKKIKQISKNLNIINIFVSITSIILINLIEVSSYKIIGIFAMLMGLAIFSVFFRRDAKLAAISFGVIFPVFSLSFIETYYLLPIILTYFACLFLVYVDDLLFKRINSNDLESKAYGLKNYIKSFANFENKPLEQIAIWEEFYVYAVAFEVKKI
jgi:uncharacterized membrane protein